ncbi:unnamed protein product, partial [Dibothriocephalus latus]
RQIGHDKLGRPVIYACFAQASTNKNTGEDTVAHCVQMLENTKKTVKKSASAWVFVFDCTVPPLYMHVENGHFLPQTGMTLPCCNPKLGRQVMNVFGDYYPERLGQAIILNHSKLFYGIWKTIRKFLDPVTASKMVFLKKDQMSEGLRERFDEELAQWLESEINLNREITEEQKRFWEKPTHSSHDPRGCPAYVQEYIDTYSHTSEYQPHPNIVDLETGKLQRGVELPKVHHHHEKFDPIDYGIEDDMSVNSDISNF